MTSFLSRTLAGLLAVALIAGPAASRDDDEVRRRPGPQEPEQGDGRQQLWHIPLAGQDMLIRATLLRPIGEGPFPLAVINHGSTQNAVRRERYAMPRYGVAARWFLERGYAVILPLRPGHGPTGGPYLEDQGRCESPDYRTSGHATAVSIQSAVDYMTAQSFVQSSGVVVVGHSAGGWGALALASRNPAKVRAAINFAGGRGGHADGKPNQNCAPGRLVATAGEFGRTARVPTLWLYSANDSYFAPALSQRLYDVYRRFGGPAEYHLLPAFGGDGHEMLNSSEAAAHWGPIVARFLTKRR